MRSARHRSPTRLWLTTTTAGILVACNAVLGMEELPRAPEVGAGRAGSDGSGGNSGSAGSQNSGGRETAGESGQGQGGDASGTGGAGGSGGASGGGAGGNGGTGGKAGSGGGGIAGRGGMGGSPPEVCVPDGYECVDGHALHCNLEGTDYDSDTLCTTDQTCVAGTCEDHECAPESSFCSGGDVHACADDGLSSSVSAMCGVDQYCDVASATCKDGVCAPNEPACNLDVPTTCNANGSGFTAGGVPCNTGTTCEGGTCKTHVCTPNAVSCQGLDLQQCATNGLTSTVLQTCQSDEYCSTVGAGSCEDQICVPGTKTCSGNTSQACNQAGSATIDTVCTSGFCDASTGDCRTTGEIVGGLDGRLLQVRCADQPSSDDCKPVAVIDGAMTACTGGTLDLIVDHPIGGTPGVQYQATLHFYGIVDAKIYGPNVNREAGTVRPMNLDTGATPVPWATAPPGVGYMTTSYNTYEIHVLDQNNTEQAQYFLNSDTGEGHFTYVLNYTKTIPVIGGGTVRLRSYDSNCRIIKNCTTGPYPCASKARSIDVSAANPQPVLTQPGLGLPADHSGQWLLIDVTAVQ